MDSLKALIKGAAIAGWALFVAAVWLFIAVLAAGCGSKFIFSQEQNGLVIVRKASVAKAEREVWESYSKRWFSMPYPQPRTIALSSSDLKEEFLIHGGSVERANSKIGLGGFYLRSTMTVYYAAGQYRALLHEYCHYAHHVKKINLTAEEEEKRCRAAAGY